MKRWFNGLVVDYPMLASVLALVLVGLVCLYSATAGDHKNILATGFGKQIFWFFVGCLVFGVVLVIPYKVFFRGSYFLYGISLILLLTVLFLHAESVHRWIAVGPFRFQPSEVAKVATLLALARFLSQMREPFVDWKRFFGALGFVLLPMVLVAKEPDVGTASVFLAMLVVMLVWAGIGWRIAFYVLLPFVALISGFHVLGFIGFMVALVIAFIVTKPKWWVGLVMGGICLSLGVLAPAVWARIEPYQQQRLLIFLGMKSDPHGAAYQVIQSKVAIGSGGIWGKGFLQGSQTQLRFLPEQHTDFIFSVLGEEFGFIGVAVVMFLFLLLFFRMFRAAKTTRNRFASFVAIGCVSVLVFQFVVNIGMTVGFFPVTGLPIPFLSYGGSSFLMAMTLVALTANVSGRRYEY